jgi:hypothetical protein
MFQAGSQGPYTLSSGSVTVENPDVVEHETSPAGTHGICSAAFDFAKPGRRPDAILAGDIGGLSRTTSGRNLTIDLGLTLHGEIISSTNCGPNNEDTASHFGIPPRITSPISVTATMSSAGVVTVDGTSTYALGGGTGTQTDHMRGF